MIAKNCLCFVGYEGDRTGAQALDCLVEEASPPGMFLGLRCTGILEVVCLKEYGAHAKLDTIGLYIKMLPRVGVGQHRSA